MTRSPADASAQALGAAIEGNAVEYWRTCSRYLLAAEFHDDAELTWFITGIPFAPWFNQVLRTRLAPDDLQHKITAALATFAQRRLPMLWSAGPSDRPVDLANALQARGLTLFGELVGMAIDLEPLADEAPVADLTIERATGLDGLDRWAQAYIGGFEMLEAPGRALSELYADIGFGDDAPFRHFVGLLDGQPVASSTVFLGERAAGVWHVSTLPGARGRGVGAAMTLAPLQHARALGYRLGTLYAAPMGVNVYRRLGFKEYVTMTQYAWSPPAAEQ